MGACGVHAFKIDKAYRQAVGKWGGCDWYTEFGAGRLDLNGLKASQALLLARATSGNEKKEWDAVVRWLTVVEQEAAMAERQAGSAAALARAGRLTEALGCARLSCAIESKYHRMLVWQPLRAAIEEAILFADD